MKATSSRDRNGIGDYEASSTHLSVYVRKGAGSPGPPSDQVRRAIGCVERSVAPSDRLRRANIATNERLRRTIGCDERTLRGGPSPRRQTMPVCPAICRIARSRSTRRTGAPTVGRRCATPRARTRSSPRRSARECGTPLSASTSAHSAGDGTWGGEDVAGKVKNDGPEHAPPACASLPGHASSGRPGGSAMSSGRARNPAEVDCAEAIAIRAPCL